MSERSIDLGDIELHVAIAALYHGTEALGMGTLHDRPTLTAKDVLEILEERMPDYKKREDIYFDYFLGRPFKMLFVNGKNGWFVYSPIYYDRDAGRDKCFEVVEKLKRSQPLASKTKETGWAKEK